MLLIQIAKQNAAAMAAGHGEQCGRWCMQGSGGCGGAAPRLRVRPRSAEPASRWVSHLIRTHCCAGHVSCPLTGPNLQVLLHMRMLSERRPGAISAAIKQHGDNPQD